MKTKWGYTDARLSNGVENCDICANDVFRNSWKETGVSRKAFEAPEPVAPNNPTIAAVTAAVQSAIPVVAGPSANASPAAGNVDQETLVRLITDRVMAALKG